MLRKLVLLYLVVVAIAVHVAGLGLLLWKPDLVREVYYRVSEKAVDLAPALFLSSPALPSLPVEEEIALNFASWQPREEFREVQGRSAWIDGRGFDSLAEAAAALEDYDTLVISAGVYQQGLVISASNVRVLGNGHVVIEKAQVQGKAAIVVSGDNVAIENIECRLIAVSDMNGACVRHEGHNLRLAHVFFHNSQQGLLTGYEPGLVEIVDSRFELLGQNGRAHGIYVGGGELMVSDSLFIAAKSSGHEIKSRASVNVIEKSVVASFSSTDSRLIDISNGGSLLVRDSVLAQGPNSENRDLIGFALEGKYAGDNRVELYRNIIFMERLRGNELLNLPDSTIATKFENNIVVSSNAPQMGGINYFFRSREEAGLDAYPILPALTDDHLSAP
jgi:hypothetical protein